MATSTTARDVNLFCVFVSGNLKTVSGFILTFRFSYQLVQRKAFVCVNNKTKYNLPDAIGGSNEGSIDLTFPAGFAELLK